MHAHHVSPRCEHVINYVRDDHVNILLFALFVRICWGVVFMVFGVFGAQEVQGCVSSFPQWITKPHLGVNQFYSETNIAPELKSNDCLSFCNPIMSKTNNSSYIRNIQQTHFNPNHYVLSVFIKHTSKCLYFSLVYKLYNIPFSTKD